MTLKARLRLDRPGFDLDVDFATDAQGITAVFGPSGCGKTTLLRCLAGLERATGEIRLDDHVWQDSATQHFVTPQARRLGYVAQDAALFTHLTVRGNLEYGWRRTPAPERRVTFERVSGALALEPLLMRRPEGLSGGERQRVAIGRALLTSPRLLLLDEPLASLDTQHKREILPFLRRITAEFAVPVVYVTHDVREVAQLANALLVMARGRVVVAGAVNDGLRHLALADGAASDAGTALDADVVADHHEGGVTELRLAQNRVFVPQRQLPVGSRCRIFIPASNVSIGMTAPVGPFSMLNVWPATIAAIARAANAAHGALVTLDIGVPLLARITAKSLQDMQLREGQSVYAYVKAIALGD